METPWYSYEKDLRRPFFFLRLYKVSSKNLLGFTDLRMY